MLATEPVEITPVMASGPSQSIGVILKALDFAAGKHRSQRRKDAEASPYINHPIALAHLLWNESGVTDPIVIVTALLHDTLEDTDTTPAEIEAHFGAEIRDLVMELTDDKSLAQAERKQRQIDHAPHLSRRARLAKLADKISNLRDMVSAPPANWSLERRQHYFEWAKQVVDQIRGSHPKLEAIFDAVYQQKPTH
jgi:guanosine-3',5'-bis(diphosphate) 3'-pyrophosphohydrolase